MEIRTYLNIKGDPLMTRLLIEPVDEALIIEFAKKVEIPHGDGIQFLEFGILSQCQFERVVYAHFFGIGPILRT
jgi:hypothetical protein